MGQRISYREALRQALREALLADPRVFLMGEDVGRYGGTYAVSAGNNFSSIFSTHSFSKAVLICSLLSAWLKCPFHIF
jgi:hypothetical protein